jgi:Uma2 family endonuclease
MQTKPTDPGIFETKPATEWLFGGPVQKVMPRYEHALFQRLVAERLGHWAEDRGRVGTEWRFWVTPEGEAERYLVPDVAYVSYARLPREARYAASEPHIAPDAIFEVRSRDDRNIYVEHKVGVYLRAGTDLVCILDPYGRRLVAHDCEQMQILGEADTFSHAALPGFSLSLPELFAALDA